MARETSRFNGEVLDAVAPRDEDRILEIGFGHGRTLLEASIRAPGATLAGIDISADAERAAAQRCRSLVNDGRLQLHAGDAASLPWSDHSFSAAYSVHTIYFWPSVEAPLVEIRRVLRDGGRLVLGMRERTEAIASHFPPSVYRFYSTEEISALLHGAGFVRVDVGTTTSGPDLRIIVAST